ncbi:MAG: hypothetical protein BACD_00182 [Bacteroides rodentium]
MPVNDNNIVSVTPGADSNLPSVPANNIIQNFNNSGSGAQIANNNGTVYNAPVYILDGADPNIIRILKDRFPGTAAIPSAATAWCSLSDTHFNIFVLDNETYMNNVFCMPNRFCMPDDMMEPALKKKYKDLDDDSIKNICELPCVFAHRNNSGFKSADPSLPVVIGRVTDITPQTENIKFVFEAYKTDIGQQLFNDYASSLGLIDVSLRNELDVEHWSIKSGNLKGFISSHGIIVS